MASILPFRAYRYNLARVRPEDVLTQPYDKISPAMYARYLERSPYNLARLILPAPPAEAHGVAGMAEPRAYEAVAERMKAWIQDGIMQRDRGAAVYPYRQSFIPPGGSQRLTRQGFIALGRLEDYDRRVVFRHEQTLAGPKADRLALLRATHTHFGQVFMLYSDPGLRFEAELWEHARQPLFELEDEYGVQHSLYRVIEPEVIERLQTAMRNRELVIADGHHRYETALAWRNEQARQRGNDSPAGAPPAEAGWNYAMMTFINLDAPGLVVLPTHRLVSGLTGFNAAKFLAAVGAHLAMVKLELAPEKWAEAWPQIEAAFEARHGGTTIAAAALAGESGVYLFRWKAENDRERLLESYPAIQRQLDVVALHELLLHRGLGITSEDVRAQRYIGYEREPRAALAQVARGEAQAAFLLRPLAPAVVRDVAIAGGVMPQKSTDFYPKLLSGLTLYCVEQPEHLT